MTILRRKCTYELELRPTAVFRP